MRRLLLSTAVLAALAVPASSDAATRHVIRGAGWGHGIGMSQYGAYGYALEGTGYREILAHYYTGTRLTRAAQRSVRVLLQPDDPYIRVRGATRADGKRLKPVQDLHRASVAGAASRCSARPASGSARFSSRLRLERPGRRAAAARPGAQRRERRALPGRDRDPGRRRARRDQRGLARRLRARRGGRRDARLVAARGAQGPGRDRAHLRAGHAQAGRPVRPLPGHALSGLPRRDRRGRAQQRRRGRHRRAGSSPTAASRP